MTRIKVFAIAPHKVARVSDSGRVQPPPAWVGWDGDKPREDGEIVNDHAHYRRAARRGECTIETTTEEAL